MESGPARHLICCPVSTMVVHLAGASIAGRFTDRHKAAIRDSRIEPTRRLADAAALADDGPAIFRQARRRSATTGSDRGDAPLS